MGLRRCRDQIMFEFLSVQARENESACNMKEDTGFSMALPAQKYVKNCFQEFLCTIFHRILIATLAANQFGTVRAQKKELQMVLTKTF